MAWRRLHSGAAFFFALGSQMFWCWVQCYGAKSTGSGSTPAVVVLPELIPPCCIASTITIRFPSTDIITTRNCLSKVDGRDKEHFPQQQPLLKALPHLPALKHLEVRGKAIDELLLGITPANAPALRTLKGMELLPDDALLEVMQYLKIEDLLACRLVCRRLGALALLPEVWRHQCFELVFFDDTPHYNQCSVLRLAPCLRAWHVNIPLKEYHTLYTTTRCAVNELGLRMSSVSENASLQASLVIRNQAALGRLRKLSLSLYPSHDKDASVLLGTVASTPHLEKLQLKGFVCYPPSILAGLHRTFPVASLKSFEHDPQTPGAESFCDFILSTHAATLESADLGYCPLTSTSTAALLAGLPNLRRLQCGMMPGLEAVAGCEQLRDLELSVDYDGEARAAAEFLRRATQLVKVTLEYEPEIGMAPSSDMDFVLALAATGRSHLEELEINVDSNYPESFPQQSLLKALPRLPALKTLVVRGDATDEFLLGITPANAPALRTLKVFTISVECAHDALHRGAVQQLLSLNPELEFSTYVQSNCYTDDRCAWCLLGCHQEMRDDTIPPGCDDADWFTIPRWEIAERFV